jgi:hypothetical protein
MTPRFQKDYRQFLLHDTITKNLIKHRKKPSLNSKNHQKTIKKPLKNSKNTTQNPHKNPLVGNRFYLASKIIRRIG